MRAHHSQKGVSEKAWKLVAETTSAAILAKETLVPPKKPGLDRQPKVLNAIGIGGILKNRKNHGKTKSIRSFHSVMTATALDDGIKHTTSGAPIPHNAKSKDRTDKERRYTRGGRKSSEKKQQAGSIAQLSKKSSENRGSLGSGGSKSTDEEKEKDNWELFNGGELIDEELLKETGPMFEMAVVEIEVNDAQEEMDKVLVKMLDQARTTEREKTVLADTFGMFLQALVHMQEAEVETIDHLQTKSGILSTINYFLNATEIISPELHLDSVEKVEEDAGIGLLESIHAQDEPKSPDGEEKAEKGKSAHGVSVDEMNATTLRDTYLTQRNKLDMQAHLKTIYALEIKQLQFEKTLMDLHYAKMVKPADLAKEMKELKKAVQDLQLEFSVIQQESASLKSAKEAEEKLLREDELITDQLDLEMLTRQMEVQQNANKPMHIAKEADREAHRLEQIMDYLDELNKRWTDGMDTMMNHQEQIDVQVVEFNNLVKEENRMFHLRKSAVAESEALSSDMEILLRKEQNLLDKNAACTESMALAGRTKKKLNDEMHHVVNHTNKTHREYQRLERLIRLSHDGFTNSKLAYEKMRSAFEATRPREGDSNNWEKLSKMFQREIGNLKRALSAKVAEASFNAEKVEKLQIRLNELYDEQIDCGKELQDLIRTTVKKRRERQEKAEQCIKLEAQVQRLASDNKMQQLVIGDCARAERDVHKMMRFVRKRYAQLKIDRASLLNDLIQTRQKQSEQIEKIKICSNEVDSYNNQMLDRARELQRAHFVNLNAGLARDSVRNDALRAINQYRAHKTERDELRWQNNNFRLQIQTQQDEVVKVRNDFEKYIHESSQLAFTLRERTEEVCTLIERMKAYESIILNGKAELTLRILEKSKLETLFEEVKKHVLIVTINQPDEGKFVREIEGLRSRVYQVTRERLGLEAVMNNVYDESRRREIRFDLMEKRETPELLDVRLVDLETSLATRDCLSLERDLILRQVEEFTEDAIGKANYLKEHYAKEVKMLVGLRKALSRTSNRIDGMICETSLATAKAEFAEARYLKLKDEVEQAQARYECGMSPSEEMEKEFVHILWREEMIHRANNRPKGFLIKRHPHSGSRIIMERLRPKKCSKISNPSRIPTQENPMPLQCETRPYRISNTKDKQLVTSKAGLVRNKAGLGLCHHILF